jgi:RNase P subunit RPR2
MTQHPTLDWTCAHCGAHETWDLVKREEPHREDAPGAPSQRPTLDWTCAVCGTTDTYMLVPATASA